MKMCALLATKVLNRRRRYESIDIHAGSKPPPPLTAQECARRVAIQMRGGYCFIVVSAFSALLQTLGFTVSLHTAFCGDEDDPRIVSGDAWGDHVVLVAHLPCGYYIADVVRPLTVHSFWCAPILVIHCQHPCSSLLCFGNPLPASMRTVSQGLGTGPSELIPLEERIWYEGNPAHPFRYELQRRPEPGRWRLVNDPCAGFSGFTVKLDSSAASPTEFDSMHHRYWADPESSFVKRGPCALRVLADGSAYLRLIGRTLQRTRPASPNPATDNHGGSKLGFSVCRD